MALRGLQAMRYLTVTFSCSATESLKRSLLSPPSCTPESCSCSPRATHFEGIKLRTGSPGRLQPQQPSRRQDRRHVQVSREGVGGGGRTEDDVMERAFL